MFQSEYPFICEFFQNPKYGEGICEFCLSEGVIGSTPVLIS